jgi:hypothetical protein
MERLVTFGASPDAIFELAFGLFATSGKLPFELPSSLAAIRFEHGLTHDKACKRRDVDTPGTRTLPT